MAAAILCAGGLLANPVTAAGLFCPVVVPPLAPPPTHTGKAATMTADKVAMTDGVATAIGDVRVEQQGQALEAPRLSYDRKTTQVIADNGLKYFRPGLYLTADSADVHIGTDTGEFSAADYTLTANGGRGQATHVEALGDGHYNLADASYTTCAGATKAWVLSASHIKLDQTSGRGKAYNTVLRFYGVPIMYTPYLNFPLDERRYSGLLTPIIGHSSDSGYELAVPYYFNLAPNYDATVIPHLLSKRGLMLEGQFRYLSKHHKGEVDGTWLPHDSEYGDDRELLHFKHIGKLAPHLGIEAQFNSVSDDDYFDDLSSDLANTSHTHLERSLGLDYERTGVRMSVLAQDFQNLNSSEPYALMPQVQLNLETPTAPFHVGVDSEFTVFRSDSGIDAQRTDLRPHLNWGIDPGGWFANSEVALRYTRYHFTEDDPGTGQPRSDISRSIPSFSLGGGLRFMRTLDNGWLQTLEPQAKYLYKGYEDQSAIPEFDTGVPDLQYDRLFSNQRFVGVDRIVDANQITLGVSSSLIAPDSGREVLKLELGRILSFSDPRVQWSGPVETGFSSTGNSDYVASAQYRPTANITTGFIAQYNPDAERFDRAIARVGYRNDAGFRVNLAWRRYEDFRKIRGKVETLEQTAIGLAFPVTRQLDFVGRWNYSLENSRNVETLAGFEYRPSCCWAARLSWRRYIANRDGSYDNAVMFQFVLRGLGAFGDTAHSIVDDNIFDDRRSRYRDFDTISYN